MDLKGRRRSRNVEDRRGNRGGSRGGFGGGFGRGGFSRGGLQRRGTRMNRSRGGARQGGMGIFGILIAMGVAWMLGINPGMIMNMLSGGGGGLGGSLGGGGGIGFQQQAPQQQQAPISANDPGRVFVEQVLASTEDTWTQIFQSSGQRYPQPTLVLFSDQVRSACGFQTAATGPFYCPGDKKVYLDLAFFEEMQTRLGAGGDFAAAYVIAHEVGHHIQTVLGISKRISAMKRGRSKAEQNALSVAQELQADCFAGVWGFQAKSFQDIMSRGDIEEAMRAAAAIGDDTMQRNAGRRVRPESFTHGSSKQRQEWFMRGFRSGDVQRCDTLDS